MRESKKRVTTGVGESEAMAESISATAENSKPLQRSGRSVSPKSRPMSKSGTLTEQVPPAAALRQIAQSTIAMGLKAKFLTVKQGRNKAGEFGVMVWIPGHEFIDGNLTVKGGLL